MASDPNPNFVEADRYYDAQIDATLGGVFGAKRWQFPPARGAPAYWQTSRDIGLYLDPTSTYNTDMADDQQADQHSEEEAQRRFEALIRAALNTPPKPMKEIPRQRPYQPRKRKAAKTAAPASTSRSRA